MTTSNHHSHKLSGIRRLRASDIGAVSPEQTLSTSSAPFGAASSDEQTAFVSVSDGISLMRDASGSWEIAQLIALNARPYGIAIYQTTMAVACQQGGDCSVVFIDLQSYLISGEVVLPANGGTIEVLFSLDGQYVFAANEWDPSVSVIQVNGGSSPSNLGEIPLGNGVVGLACDSEYLYVTSEQGGSDGVSGLLQVIDIDKAIRAPGVDAVAGRVDAGQSPVRVVLTDNDGTTYAWVTARGTSASEPDGPPYNAVMTFDAAAVLRDPDQALVATTGVGPAPVGILAFNNDSMLAVANSNRCDAPYEDSTMTVLDADAILSGGTSTTIATVDVGAFPRQFGITPRGDTFFLTNYNSNQVMVFGADQFSSN